MKKTPLIIATAIAVSVLFTGCSTQPVKITRLNNISRDIVVPEVKSYTRARTINATNRRLLQATAEETIRSGYKTFAFTVPAKIANGSIKNADDFLDRCADKSAIANIGLGVATLGIASNMVYDDCGIFSHPWYSSDGFSAIDMNMSNDLNSGIDASVVIEDLKKKGLLQEITAKHADNI